MIATLLLICLFPEPQMISGSVQNQWKEPLKGATVLIEETQTGTTTNELGYFQIKVPSTGSYTINVSFVGYESESIQVEVPQKVSLLISLKNAIIGRDDVIITTSPSGSSVAYRPTSSMSLKGLHDKASDNFADMLKSEPGLSIRSFGSAPSRPIIRGFDGDRVLILENGERMGDLAETAADHAISMDSDAAERIELVRGPAGFLYGSSAMGGVVNIFNNDIPLDWSNGLSGRTVFTGMSVNEGGAAFGKVTLGQTHTAVSARLSYRNSGNVSTPTGKLSGTFNESLNGAVGAGFQGESFKGGLALSFVDQTYGIPDGIDDPTEDVEIRLDRLNLAGHGDLNLNGFFDQMRLRFNLTRYQHDEFAIFYDMEGVTTEEIGLSFKSISISSSLLIIRSANPGKLSGAIGANYFARGLKVGGSDGLTPDATGFNAGIFGYQDVPLSEKVSLQTGIRMDYRKLEAKENDRFAQPDEPLTESVAISGSVGLNIQPLNYFETGIQLARSFRAPSLEELYTDAVHLGAGAYEIGDPNLKNEVGHGLDIFMNYERSNFSVNLSSFYYHISNYIIYQPTDEIHAPSGLPIFVYESDDARYMGFEADVHAQITPYFGISSGLDVVRANRLSAGNEPIPFIPPTRIRSSVKFDTGKWFASTDIRYAFEQNQVASNEDVTPDYLLVDLTAGLRFDSSGRHLITLRIENLLNKAYRDHLSRIEDRNNPMPGRGAMVRYQFIF